MLRRAKKMIRANKEPYKVPRRVQDLIPIRRVWEDGVFQVCPELYAKTFRFTDINYLSASLDTRAGLYDSFTALLNGLDPDAMTKITLVSRPMQQDFYDQRILMPFREDGKDEYRKECNDLVAGKSGHGLGTALERYVTVSVCRRSYQDAVEFFNQESFRLCNAFSELGSECKPLDAAEKLKLLAGFYRPEDAESYDFSPGDMARKGHDPRDAICPDSMEKTSDSLRIGNRWARVFYLKNYASVITDKLISDLMAAGTNVTLSMDILSVPTDEAMREVEQKLLGVETNITNWQRRQNRNNNFSANVPYDMELQRTETTAFLDDLMRKNQKMLLCVLTMLLTADTQEQLDRETKALLSAAEGKMCQMAVLKFQQLDGLNTVLPIGPRKLESYRTLISECQAVFVPFRIVEVMDPGGTYFGENAVSHNPILINRTNLMNQAAMLFGVPGSGKSFMAKQMLAWIILNTKDRVFVCDPEGEYGRLAKALCNDCVVFRLSDGGADRLNALTMVEGYAGTEQESISTKVDFILSLLELLDNCETGPQEKSLIDRCLKLVFAEQKRTGVEPTLRDLREKLLEQPEPEARAIALSMESYTLGSMNIFGGASTVDLNKRVVIFDIHNLHNKLRPAGMLVMTDTIMNCASRNWMNGIRTHVILDEFHVFLEKDKASKFISSAWRMFRKRNVQPTAITQNVDYLLNHDEGRMMLSNSELLVMLNQARNDQAELARLLNLSPEQLNSVNNAKPGCGLIRCGPSLIPFENHFPKNTKLYKLMTTDPNEKWS